MVAKFAPRILYRLQRGVLRIYSDHYYIILRFYICGGIFKEQVHMQTMHGTFDREGEHFRGFPLLMHTGSTHDA